MDKPKVLILCTGNSCRSHMVEGWLRHLGGDLFEVFSAGSDPAGYVHPLAIEAMGEVGIGLEGHSSKHLGPYVEAGIDFVVTVCDNAREACPVFPGKVERYHWGFEDPPRAVRSGESELDAFRRIRDEIGKVMDAFVAGYRAGWGRQII